MFFLLKWEKRFPRENLEHCTFICCNFRKVVALQLIFDRLEEGGAWSHIDGVKYLASVQKCSGLGRLLICSNLTPEEFQKLREYPLCPSRADKFRMIVSQLYEPNPDLEK